MKYWIRAASPLFGAACAAALSFAATAQPAVPAHAVVAAAPAGTPVEFDVFLPLRHEAELDALLAAQQTTGGPQYHAWLTPDQFGRQFGPTAESFGRVKAGLAAAGLQVTETHTRSLHVRGSAGQVNSAFGVRLDTVSTPATRQRLVAASPLRLPDALQQEGVIVAAFTGVPDKRTSAVKLGPVSDNRYSPVGPYNYDDMKQAYDYPSYESRLDNGQRLDGTGVRVAVVMATDALDSDIAGMFDHEHFTDTTGVAAPTIEHLPIRGGAPFDGPGDGASVEASLDVQQVLGGAPGASVTLMSLPNLSDEYILDAYVKVADDDRWDIVNSSFGGCELLYTPAYNGGTSYVGILKVFDQVFKQGNAEGITWVASTGDSGALECPDRGYFRGSPNAKFIRAVQTPADDPHVTTVGGGNLLTTTPSGGSLTSKYVSENSFGDPEIPYDPYGVGVDLPNGEWGAGGGRSVLFAQPSYQDGVLGTGGQGRALPDVGMQVGGCPGGLLKGDCPDNRSAAIVNVGGGRYGVIGTSVASPEFVGALALYEQMQGGRLGNVNKFLYDRGLVQDSVGAAKAPRPARYYHKDIRGFDGVYGHASTAYDYMIGNGTPDVRVLFGMTRFDKAGDPQTASNP